MLHHLSFGVADLVRATTFYDAVLSALGYQRVWTDDDAIGYGLSGGGDLFCLKLRGANAKAPGDGFHLAFAAPSPAAVVQFHAVALLHGGIDNGSPGLRLDYGDDYFAAFVIDPDGHHIEAVWSNRCTC
ncbi:VOC family protein [Chitinivorax sp. B]|uniref:VOC family protein n=1 Tax=Chitinivorax sp. B TaxID=2502235 RepID=UPI0010F6D065|nr:VOC family protein [Chitinivorax sp. B]